jgi:hypothetical protein
MADKQSSLRSFLKIPSPNKGIEGSSSTPPVACLERTSAKRSVRKRVRTEEQEDAEKSRQHNYYQTVTKPKREAEKALKDAARKLNQEKVAEASSVSVPLACGPSTAEKGRCKRIGRLQNHSRYVPS